MNDTNATTGTLADEDRHAIQTYLSDALALERHIRQPLKRQMDMDESAQFGEATALMSRLESLTEAHIRALEERLDAAGGHAGSPVKSAWSQLLGAGAAVVDSARKTKVSKNLRDDFTALALASASYSMLLATALGLGDDATAKLAQRHLEDYAQMTVHLSKALPGVVLEELALDGEHVRVTAAQIAEQITSNAYR
jgi:ferritin-like metal-binding protein YciE